MGPSNFKALNGNKTKKLRAGIERDPIWSPIHAGTGMSRLAPPWGRDQVRWLSDGYYVLRLATEEQSRWFLGCGLSWRNAFPHERTFRRSAIDKGAVIERLAMNPWPAHLGVDFPFQEWRAVLAQAIEKSETVLDSGHITLWRLEQLPEVLSSFQGNCVVLDGHHSRRAQRNLRLKKFFGWVEALDSPQLQVRAIHRSGWLAQWLDELIASRSIMRLERGSEPQPWQMNCSQVVEVVQADKRWWCEVCDFEKGETALDALTRMAKGRVLFRSSSSFEEILNWLENVEVDTALRLPAPTKEYVLQRSLERKLFPQKATYFYPKIPFGLLVQDLRQELE
ncbi:MAG: hypothetical protein AB1540_07960 [Bdellovibrionota bacterium]